MAELWKPIPEIGGIFFISSADLWVYLCDAGQHASNVKERGGYIDLLKSRVKRRRRSSTPAGRLTTDDESRFREEEERAVKRIQHGDQITTTQAHKYNPIFLDRTL